MCPSHRRSDNTSFNISRRFDVDGERSQFMETIGDRDHVVQRSVFVPIAQPQSPKLARPLSERLNDTEKNAFSLFQQEVSGKRTRMSQSPDKEKLRRISLAEEKLREEQEQAAKAARKTLKDLRDLGNVTFSDSGSEDYFPDRQFSLSDDQDQDGELDEDVLNMDFLKDIDGIVNPDRKEFADLTLSDIELDESDEGPGVGGYNLSLSADQLKASPPVGKSVSRLPQKGKFGLDRMKSKMPMPARYQKTSPPSKLTRQDSKIAKVSGIPGAQKRPVATQASTSKAASSKRPMSRLPQKASTEWMPQTLDTSTKMPALSKKSGIKGQTKRDLQRQRPITEQSFKQQASPPHGAGISPKPGSSGIKRPGSTNAPYFQSPRPPPGKQQGLDPQLADKKNKIMDKYVRDLETSKKIKDPTARKQTINVLRNNLVTKLQKLETYAGQLGQDVHQSILADIAAREEQNRAIKNEKTKLAAKTMDHTAKTKAARSTKMQIPQISIIQPEKSQLQAKKAQYSKMMRQSLDPRMAAVLESHIDPVKSSMKTATKRTQEIAKLRAKSIIDPGKAAKSLAKSGISLTPSGKQATSKLAKSQKLAIGKGKVAVKQSAKKTSDSDKAAIIAKAKEEFEAQKELAEQTIEDEDALNQTLEQLGGELNSKLHFIDNLDKYKESVQTQYEKEVSTARKSIADKDILKERLDFLREDSLNKTAYLEESAGLPRQSTFRSQSADVKEKIGDIAYRMSLPPTKRASILPSPTLPAIEDVRRKSGLPKPRKSGIPGLAVAQRKTMSPTKAAVSQKPVLSLMERRKKAEEKYLQGIQASQKLYKDDERMLEAHRELVKGEYLATLAQLKEEGAKQKARVDSTQISATGATMRTSALPLSFHAKGKLPISTKNIPQKKRQSMTGKTGIPLPSVPVLPRKSLPMPSLSHSLIDNLSPPPTPPPFSLESLTSPKIPTRHSGPRGSLGKTPTQASPHRRDTLNETSKLQVRRPATPIRSLQKPRPHDAAERSYVIQKMRTTRLRGTSVEQAQLKTAKAVAHAWKMPQNTCATVKKKKMLEKSLNELIRRGATNKDLLKTFDSFDKVEVPISRANIHPIAKYIGLDPGQQVEKVLEKANARTSAIEEQLNHVPPTVEESMQQRDQLTASPLAAEEADGIFKMMMHQSQGLDLTKEPNEIVGLIVPSQGPKLSIAGMGVESPSKGVIPDQVPLREINEISDYNAEEFASIVQQQPPHQFPQDSIAVKRLPEEPIAVPSLTEPKTREDYIQHDLVLHSFQVENYFQAKGSTFPDWFPGIYSVFPEEQPKLILKKTPSEVLLRAWQIMKPKIF